MALAGQSNAALSLTNVQPWQAGNYDIVVVNAVGSVTSAVARLTVLPAANPVCIPAPSGLVGWWPGDGNANELVSGNHGSLQNGASANSIGYVSQSFASDGVDDVVDVGNPPTLQITGAITVQAWFKTTAPQGNYRTLVGKWVTGCGGGPASYALGWKIKPGDPLRDSKLRPF